MNYGFYGFGFGKPFAFAPAGFGKVAKPVGFGKFGKPVGFGKFTKPFGVSKVSKFVLPFYGI